MRYLDISPEDLRDAEARLKDPRDEVLGHLAAMSVSGNDVSGSVFYAFPLVVAAAGTLLPPGLVSSIITKQFVGIYSPLCLLTASLLLLFFRPLLLELASTVRINGSYVYTSQSARMLPPFLSSLRNYIYLLQFSGKMLSLVGAAATLLDAVATSTVSAATASAYLSAEIHAMPISASVLTVLFLVALGILALAGIRESASATAAVFVFHARPSLSHVINGTPPSDDSLTVDDSDGRARGCGCRSLGHPRSPFRDPETELGATPCIGDRDRPRDILRRVCGVSRRHRCVACAHFSNGHAIHTFCAVI